MPIFKGKNVSLYGERLNVGDVAPIFKAINNDLDEVSLTDFKGKKLISVIPSIDTGVCDFQTRKFNEEMANVDNLTVITISMDLPFAQARWCGANGLANIVMLSDHRLKDFGTKYGNLINEFQLLNRSIFVLDENNVVLHVEYLEVNSDHPDYDAVRRVLKDA